MSTKRLHRKRTLEKAHRVQDAVYDPFADFEGNRYELMVAKTFYYIRENIRTVLLVAGAAVVIAGGLIVFSVYNAIQEEKALLAYEELLENPVMTAAADPSAAIKKLDDYMASYSVEGATRRALLHKIALLEQAGKKKEAADVSVQLADRLEAPALQAYMLARATLLYEDAGENGAALSSVERALSLLDEEGQIRASLLFAQARALRASGKESAARQVIETLMKMDSTDSVVAGIQEAALVFVLDEQPSRQ